MLAFVSGLFGAGALALAAAWAEHDPGATALAVALAGIPAVLFPALAARSWSAAIGAGAGAAIGVGVVVADVAVSDDSGSSGIAFGLLSIVALAPVYLATGLLTVALRRRLGVIGRRVIRLVAVLRGR
jgi:hypothetical protein